MIDDIKTKERFGYTSNDLKPKSGKRIVAICDDCGKERLVKKSAYRDLCMHCVQKFCYRTEKCRQERSLRVMGNKNPFYGKTHSNETKLKISKSQQERELRLLGGQSAKNKVIRRYVRGARCRGLTFELSEVELDVLFKGKCHYCGTIPSNVAKHGVSNGEFIYNGIDRLNNKIGYIISNCVSCCSMCNMAKRNLDYPYFMAWIQKLCKHNQKEKK